jgi:hypothetical protein
MTVPFAMNHLDCHCRALSRRSFLTTGAAGIGSAVLASVLGPELARRAGAAEATTATKKPGVALDRWDGVIQPLHHAAKAKRIIYLCMAGGPSHLETFDYKPKLAEMHGQPMPESFTKGKPIAQLQGQKQLKCFGPQHKFQRFGKSGQHISGIFPHVGSVADDICIVNSLVTEAINHDPAHIVMNTGTSIPGRPSMGSWINYGLGSDCDNLPGFIVLTSTGRSGQQQPIASRQWSAGFLPSRFQGVHFRNKGEAVLYVTNPGGVTPDRQRDVVDAVQELDGLSNRVVDDPEVATVITQYEMAFAMQASVPELMDISKEPKRTLELYGATPGDGTFASNCLLARRLAERGVRFIQLYHRDWDHHGNIKNDIAVVAKEVDQACAALIKDLKQRGMFDDTLIIWGGEFGRTPMAQGNGRDHHIKGFSMWLSGGGIRGGVTYGATDELGYEAVQDIFHVNDFHATLLHLLGIDHLKLTYKFQGRDFRLTDVAGKVVKEILS